jgi:hypothetical protein
VTLTMEMQAAYSSKTLVSTSETVHSYDSEDHIPDIRNILNLINFYNVSGGKMWRVTAWLSMCNKYFTCK